MRIPAPGGWSWAELLPRDRGRAAPPQETLARRLVWWREPDFEPVLGRLEDEQWYLGCHRARCGVCHPEKRWSYGDRQRAKRRWRREEGIE